MRYFNDIGYAGILELYRVKALGDIQTGFMGNNTRIRFHVPILRLPADVRDHYLELKVKEKIENR